MKHQGNLAIPYDDCHWEVKHWFVPLVGSVMIVGSWPQMREQLTACFSAFAKLDRLVLDLLHNVLSPNSEVNPQRHLKDSL